MCEVGFKRNKVITSNALETHNRILIAFHSLKVFNEHFPLNNRQYNPSTEDNFVSS